MPDGWSIAKDSLGCLGTLAVTVPWFRDFKGRLRLSRLHPIRVGAGLDILKAKLQQGIEAWIAKPKLSDLLWVVGGLMLVALSFLIGLIQTLAS